MIVAVKRGYSRHAMPSTRRRDRLVEDSGGLVRRPRASRDSARRARRRLLARRLARAGGRVGSAFFTPGARMRTSATRALAGDGEELAVVVEQRLVVFASPVGSSDNTIMCDGRNGMLATPPFLPFSHSVRGNCLDGLEDERAGPDSSNSDSRSAWRATVARCVALSARRRPARRGPRLGRAGCCAEPRRRRVDSARALSGVRRENGVPMDRTTGRATFRERRGDTRRGPPVVVAPALADLYRGAEEAAGSRAAVRARARGSSARCSASQRCAATSSHDGRSHGRRGERPPRAPARPPTRSPGANATPPPGAAAPSACAMMRSYTARPTAWSRPSLGGGGAGVFSGGGARAARFSPAKGVRPTRSS